MGRLSFVVLWVSLFCTLAYFSLPNYTLKERIDSTVARPLDTGNLSQLWFSPANELAGIALSGSRVTVRVWSAAGGSPLRERTLELTGPKDATTPTFAVSDDASRIAWIANTGVRVAPLFLSAPALAQAAELTFRPAGPISSLAFVGNGKLAALYGDGRLELRDLGTGAVIAARTISIADPAPLLSKASYLGTYSRLSHDVFVFDTASGDRLSILENTHYSEEILFAALSAQGRLAVGMREVMQEGGKAIQAPGPVRALAFYSGSRILAAGDFDGIFLISPERPPLKASSSTPGTTLLAASNSQIVFGSDRSLSVANYHLVQSQVYESIDRPSTYLALAALGLMGALVGPLWRGAAGALIRKILGIELPQPKEEPKPPEKEGAIPGPLVEACLNGDCVLFAGAGLSAQASLPLWAAAVRELAEWAAENGQIPAAQSAAALDELSAGQTGAAADLIAAALAGRERELHDCLRWRYRLAVELPAVHQLLKQIDFPALITTTFDNLLDRTFPHSGGRVHTAGDCGSLNQEVDHRSFFALKPFGDLDAPDTIRLGPTQCAEVIADNPMCPELISSLFGLHTFLFLGASLDNMERDLLLLAPNPPIGLKHYAFVAVEGEAWRGVAARLKNRWGIEVMTYSPATPVHSELVDFIASLLAAMRERTAEKYLVAGEGE